MPKDLTAQQIAEECARIMWADDQASQDLGMKITEIAPGSATLTMTITEKMVNGHNTCHGGFIFSFADSAFAFACNSRNQRAVAQHCSITYIAPGHLDDQLTAVATEVSVAGRSGIYDVHVHNQDNSLIATFRGHSRTIRGQFIPDDA